MSEPVAAEAPPPEIEIRLWDWPVRLVHWAFVLLIPAMWASAEFGQLGVHRILGYVLLGLLIFRLYWGVAGSATARFTSFVRGPAAIAGYLRSGAASIGHNPLGAVSVIALLGLLGLQIGLGLFAQDTDGQFAGPLADLVSFETSDAATEWHETMFNVLLALIGLHLAAILFYVFVRRDNLVRPMVTGRKRVAAATEQPATAPATRALIGIVLSAIVTIWIALGAPLP
ncbi:cytochrome b/b6 domain-containing protein [Sphingomonas sp. MG17]|uniref:Cytochrome b/b6 domain-containing protein n=1 Tax=Sphingomonas tagetis TaxID=2949092 RepID=A0A9X2KKQ0_9SPHN|nr:cytochrome b/b6 domain-containing protein [Sphingomonas tagetis]MCP3729852.1 cytochrome b/b6 domain-containing protein [Sphingomonas tagetis]